MSLINQVLKDLEKRHAEQLVEATHSLDGLAFAPEVASNTDQRSRIVPWLVLALVLLLAGGVYGYWQFMPPAETITQPETKPVQGMAENPVPTATQHAATQQPQIPAPVPVMDINKTRDAPVVRAKPEAMASASSAPAATEKPTATKTVPATISAPEPIARETPVAKQMVPLRSEQKAELSYQSGYQYLQSHQYRRAEQELRDALRHEAGHIRARELLAGLLIKQGRWIEASEILQRGIEISPQQRSFVTLQARTLMQLERDVQAIALLRDYAPSMQEDPEHFALLAALYQRRADHVAAANTYTQLLKVRPNAGIWWVGLGISLEALGKHAEARHAYQQAQQSGTLHADIARYTDNRLLALQAIRYPD